MAADFDSLLEVPASIRRRLQFVVTVTNAATGRGILEGTCESYTPTSNGHQIRIACLVADTSVNIEGVTWRKRFSYHETFEIGGEIIWSARPWTEKAEELENAVAAEAAAVPAPAC